MKRPDWADFAFAALVVMVGVAPVLTVPGWAGYGPGGEFSCSCGHYYVRYSDPVYGGDRPHVFAVYQGFQVDMIQMSDTASTVDGLNINSNFSMTRHLSGGTLVVDYSSPGLNFTKDVYVSGGDVHVDYAFGRNVTAVLTFWRWYYTSVGPFDRPITREIPPNGTMPFSFFGQGALFNGTLTSSPGPSSALIAGIEGAGLNKIALVFQGESVDLTVSLTAVRALAGAGVVEVASSNEAFPVIGVAMAAVYLGVRSWVKKK